MPWWLAAVATVAFVLAAAKAHGRQIRLEREQQGYFHVDFGKQNPAAVEAIWRADRRIFWPTFAALAVGWVLVVLLARTLMDLALPLPYVALVFGLDFGAAFAVAGTASWIRLARRNEGPLPWRRRAQQGSVVWWLVVAAAVAVVAVAMRT